MIVTFFGSDCYPEYFKHHEQMMDLLEEIVRDQSCDFYFGGLGEFDQFAHRCCVEYQKKHLGIALFLVAPNVGQMPLPLLSIGERYDAILYPNIENLPFDDACSRRDQWMAERADAVVMDIQNDPENVREIYRYSIKKGKKIHGFSLIATN
jgi:hypothetical protein